MSEDRPYKEIAAKDANLDASELREAAFFIEHSIDWWVMPAISSWSEARRSLVDLADEVELQQKEARGKP